MLAQPRGAGSAAARPQQAGSGSLAGTLAASLAPGGAGGLAPPARMRRRQAMRRAIQPLAMQAGLPGRPLPGGAPAGSMPQQPAPLARRSPVPQPVFLDLSQVRGAAQITPPRPRDPRRRRPCMMHAQPRQRRWRSRALGNMPAARTSLAGACGVCGCVCASCRTEQHPARHRPGGTSCPPPPPNKRPAVPTQPAQVLGKQVITRTSGRALGTAASAWVDPVRREVVSFDLVEKKTVGSNRVRPCRRRRSRPARPPPPGRSHRICPPLCPSPGGASDGRAARMPWRARADWQHSAVGAAPDW